jgi:endonuclease G, mitochondrial
MLKKAIVGSKTKRSINKLEMIAKGEDNLVKEVKGIMESGDNLPLAKKRGVSVESVKAVVNDLSLGDKIPQAEAVVVAFMRPVLFIKNGKIEIPESVELKERVLKYRPIIEQPLNSVGRIELKNHQLKNLGTGWLIAEDIIATNRHVAEVFAVGSPKGKGGIIKKNFIGQTLEAVIDFKEEYQTNGSNTNQFEVHVEKIIYLPDASKDFPDLALLKIKKSNALPAPIPFIKDKLTNDQLIGVVGYPLQDPRGVVDKEMERRIFGEVFGVKRYAPGQIIQVPDKNHWYFLHDCSTLGGNSGSLVQDMETGCAIGIHFAGTLLEANYAVKGQNLLDISTKVGIKSVFSFDKKLAESVVVEPDFVEEKPFTEADYTDRKGFETSFLENANGFVKVPLPKVKNTADVLKFGAGKKNSVLKYTHFSVAMSQSRRMCYYSAVNIDGMQYKRMKRTGWRFDPRIDEKYQIMKECYGNSPKFSRGHMTRREDPNWGPLAKQGNDDSMHVTNAVPQMQSFNAGTWLSLENYALENAKHDKQKICVMTGPFLHDSDPVKFDVQVPVEFWKVIAFIHDETDKLCATGYTMSQENYLRNDEFVFGEFMTYQVPIKLIEKKAKMSFGQLSKVDPLKDDIFESISSPIQSVRQIRFF